MPVEIGESSEPIPVHFAYRRDINIEAALFSSGNSVVDRPLRDVFDTPDLAAMDDAIANGTLQLPPGASQPLALFRAARVDYSLHRLYHYAGTDPEHFQNFVIFTNYQFYVEVFARLCRERMGSGQPGLDAFVEPGNVPPLIPPMARPARAGVSRFPDYAGASSGLQSPHRYMGGTR